MYKKRQKPASPRLNPLVGFERPAGMSWRDVYREEVPLMAPNAEVRFREVLRNIPFNLSIAVVKRRYDSSDAEEQELTILRDGLEKKGRQERVFYAILGVQSGGARVEIRNDKKWDPERVSPLTPFVVLHRLYEILPAVFPDDDLDLDGGSWVFHPGAESEEIRQRHMNLPTWICSGVDTAAGRHHALDDHSQATADLFAKWCLTGKIAFNPEDVIRLPPHVPTTRRYEKDMQIHIETRIEWKAYIAKHFEKCAALLRGGGAWVLG